MLYIALIIVAVACLFVFCRVAGKVAPKVGK